MSDAIWAGIALVLIVTPLVGVVIWGLWEEWRENMRYHD